MTFDTPSSPSLPASTPREAGRVSDRAGGHDRPLAGHQPRHRGHGADAAGVGQRDLGALVGVGRQLVVARADHGLVVGGHEGSRSSAWRRRGSPGTTSERLPSLRCMSTARPRLIAPGVTRWGLPSTSVKELAITGMSRAACTIAQAIRWVNESLRPAALSAARRSARVSTSSVAEAGGRRDRPALVHEADERGRGAADGLRLGARRERRRLRRGGWRRRCRRWRPERRPW